MRACRLALTGLLLLSTAPPVGAQGNGPGVHLVPHRAIYDLSLLRSGSQTVENARGRIAFDFGGDACDGYTLKFRQVTVLESGETRARTLDMRTTTFEAGDGKSLRFKSDSHVGGVSDEKLDGEAALVPDGSLSIRLQQPKAEAVSLRGQPVFPSEHMKRLIETAKAGGTSLAIQLYDGSDDGKKIYNTYAVIGRRIDPHATVSLEDPAKQAALAQLPRWPVAISYFKTESGDLMPAYTISFELYENGISRSLKLDYGDFVLKGDLKSLEVLPSTVCRQ
jgi:hypothetical protein